MPAKPSPKSTKSNRSGFFKTHVLPVLLIFLIPGFSAWFFHYAETDEDQKVLHQIEFDIQSDSKLRPADRAQILEFYRQVPGSKIMASNKPEAVKMQSMFEPVQFRYATFRWMQRIAWLCLATIALTFVIVGLSVAFSFRSQSAQYMALRIGWPVLRTSAAIQVLGQAVLAAELSFWVTAILTNSYFIKLIAIIGIAAVVAVIALWKAIFAKVNNRFDIEGEMVTEAEASALWQRVREMAEKLGTAAPDRIVVGIDANFFVTEHPFTLGGQTYEGRTLYLSLPLLKVLSVDEADGVLGHELAHFSGQDTFWSRKVSPLTSKFGLYLRILAIHGGGAIIVANFMHLFWKLYGLSIQKLSRAREFRADQIGAELTSKEAMKRALVKIASYCDYRGDTVTAILNKQRLDSTLNLPMQLEQGYPASLATFSQSDKSLEERVPHPFDSHPTLKNRLIQLGFDARESLQDPVIQQPVQQSWYHAISTAAALEERMWNKEQQDLQSYHGHDLAWRLQPKDDEELAIVLQHFPQAGFRTKKGAQATLEFDHSQLAEWAAPIFFKDIANATLESAWPHKQLVIGYYNPSAGRKLTSVKFYPGAYTNDKEDLLAAFGRYFGRHKTAEARSKQIAQPVMEETV